jgi:uncharacterized membrane protein
MAEGTGRGESLSIWFFVGVMTLLYGIVLLPWGVYEWNHPPANELLLGWLVSYHPTFWWGLLLTLFGLFYTLKYRPKSADKNRV